MDGDSFKSWFQIAEITIQVLSDLPVSITTFEEKFKSFQVNAPGSEVVRLAHHFYTPSLPDIEPGELVFSAPPWEIYQTSELWVYLGVTPDTTPKNIHKVALISHDHTLADIYTPDPATFLQGNLHSLTTFPTDQVFLARVLADRRGCYLHAAGLIIEGQGFAFVGHSEAGKSTITRQLMPYGEALCDDRVIIREWAEGFKIYGTWSHGEIPLVSARSAPLRAILLLEQAPENSLRRLEAGQVARELPQFIVRPLVTKDWWEKTLDLVGAAARRVPVYRLRFDRSGRVIETLRSLL